MASIFSHPAAALALAPWFERAGVSRHTAWLGALCMIVPDFDVAGLAFGIPYGDILGHRGLTHSLAFAAALGMTLTLSLPPARPLIARALFLSLCTASHGLLDALTDGGLGVAFFSPFDSARYLLPWTPVRVSPIGPSEFFTAEGAAVLASEAMWVWLPAFTLCALGSLLARRRA